MEEEMAISGTAFEKLQKGKPVQRPGENEDLLTNRSVLILIANRMFF